MLVALQPSSGHSHLNTRQTCSSIVRTVSLVSTETYSKETVLEMREVTIDMGTLIVLVWKYKIHTPMLNADIDQPWLII